MERHWSKVDSELHTHHPVKEPKVPDRAAEKPFASQVASPGDVPLKPLPSLVDPTARATAQRKDDNEQDHILLSDSEDEPNEPSGLGLARTESSEREHQLMIMRKVIRKWWRLAGLKGEPRVMDTEDEGEFVVPWTKVWLLFSFGDYLQRSSGAIANSCDRALRQESKVELDVLVLRTELDNRNREHSVRDSEQI